MLVVFQQVLILFIFGAVGFGLSRGGIVNAEHGKLLSTLLLYVFFPCSVFKTFARNCTPHYIGGHYHLALVSLGVIAVLYLAGYFGVRLFAKDDYERRVGLYTMIVPNCGYMGYALVEALLGEAALMNTMFFVIPISLFTYSVGYCMLTRTPLAPKKLLNPPIIAICLGTLVGLIGIPVPDVVTAVLSSASACVGPVSMILAGITVAQFKLRPLLTSRNAYILTALRLLTIPILAGGVLVLCGFPELAAVAVTALAMPCGLNTVVFPKLIGENCETGASLALLSNVAACATIPFVFFLFGVG